MPIFGAIFLRNIGRAAVETVSGAGELTGVGENKGGSRGGGSD
jgi:hypothetical protein